MRKTIFFTKLNYHKLEEKLSQMEKEGFRLTAISNFYQFEFAKCECKESRYFVIYNYMREYRSYQCERQLALKYQAAPVNGKFSLDDGITTIYRIANSKHDLANLSANRDKYLMHVFIQRILIPLLFLFPMIAGIIDTNPNSFCHIIMLSVSTILALFIIWNIYGVIVLFVRNRKANGGDDT